MTRSPSPWLMALALLLSVAGCSFQQKIAQNALDYNYSIEDAHNRLTLLNILRAKDRRPMYFTRLGQVTGNLTSEATGTATASFGRPGPTDIDSNIVGLESRGRYASSPSFVIQNLDSQEFYSGILRPIPPDVLQLYWNQGWPRPLLIHLFVERAYVTFTDGSDETCYLQSYPPDRASFELFAEAVDLFLPEDPVIVETREALDFGRPMAAAQGGAREIETLAAAQQAGLAAAIEDGAIQLRKESGMIYEIRYLTSGRESGSRIRSLNEQGEFARSRGPCGPADLGKVSAEGADVYLRAPQGMIYYLGELVRAQLRPASEGGYLPEIAFEEQWVDGKPRYVGEAPILRVVKDGAEDLAVSVPYRGATYGVPETDERSLQALALVQQVFALFTSAKDLPSADTIRIAN